MNQELYAEAEAPATLTDKEAALERALTFGVSPDALIKLGQDEFLPPEQSDRKFVKYALVTAGVLVTSDLAISALTGNPASEAARSVINLLLTPGNAPVAEASWRVIVGAVEQWGMTTLQNIVILGYYMGVLKSQITKSDQVQSIRKLQENLGKAKDAGVAPILMSKGFHAIDLGSGDSMGRAIGKELLWGVGSLPLLEAEKNTSGFDIWRRLPNPSKGIDKDQFFQALDSIGFNEAASFTICPVEEQQSFLPDPNNPSHFDLTFDEIIDRINLIDEYSDVRNIPRKQVVVIGDKGIQRGIGPALMDAEGKVYYGASETITLEKIVEQMNLERPENSKIIIADPTDITLELLKTDEYNPEHLPVKFYEDPQAPELYGERFIKRARAAGLEVITDESYSGKYLRIGYGLNDVATKQTATRLPSDETLAIIIDEARASGGKFRKLILSNTVRDWVVSQLRSVEQISASV